MGRKELLSILPGTKQLDSTRPSFGISKRRVNSYISQTKFTHFKFLVQNLSVPLTPTMNHTLQYLFLIILIWIVLNIRCLRLLKICSRHFSTIHWLYFYKLHFSFQEAGRATSHQQVGPGRSYMIWQSSSHLHSRSCTLFGLQYFLYIFKMETISLTLRNSVNIS